MTDKYISHDRAAQALDVFASLQDKSVEDLDAIEILEQYIKEREWRDQRLLLKTSKDNPFRLASYWGGTRMGRCIQVTIDVPDRMPRYLQMTEDEAQALAFDLLAFVAGEIQYEDDG